MRQFPQGKTMLCLPQAFELFLKNLVGGLHTVYTKCKRYFPTTKMARLMRLHLECCIFSDFPLVDFFGCACLEVQV